MEIKKLRKDNHKLVIGGLIITCILIFVVTYTTTRAKYQNTEIIPLVNGVVNYKAYDFKVMAMYKQKDGQTCTEDSCYNAITTMPETGYTINESKSYCTIDNKTHSNARLFTDELNNHVFSKITKSDKCYIWFDEKVFTSEDTLAKLNISSSYLKMYVPDFTVSAVATEDVENNGIYKTADPMYGENAESYYFRGASSVNYVKFGNYCWRIIRINGDGSIRMIYDGASCHANGTNTKESIIKTNIFYATNDGQYKNSSYVGWTYDLGSQRTLSGIDSYAKQQTEHWFSSESGFTDTQKNQIADGKFCNDRNLGTSYPWTWSANGSFNYASYDRFFNAYSPTLMCNSGDVYVLKIGAITMDELVLAGAAKSGENKKYYLYNGQTYWTMTPSSVLSGNSYVSHVNSDGAIYSSYASHQCGLRPVINLKADVTFSSGNGTQSSPFVVS